MPRRGAGGCNRAWMACRREVRLRGLGSRLHVQCCSICWEAFSERNGGPPRDAATGTPEFAELVAAALGRGNAVIWGNHGAMVVGRTLAAAFSTAHALEDSAHVCVIARQLGAPVPLPDEEVARLHAFWTERYGQRALEPQAARKG